MNLVCSEFETFAQALHGVDGRYLLTRRVETDWRLRAVELGGLVLMCGRDGGANLYQASIHRDCFALFVALGDRWPTVLNGEALAPGAAAWLVPGSELSIRVSGPARWLALMIDAQWLRRMDPGGPSRPSLMERTHVVGASPVAIERLVGLSARLLRSDVSPTYAGAQRAAGITMLEHVQAVLDSGFAPEGKNRGRPAFERRHLLDRALGLIEEGLDQPICLADLARVAGVSSRTLHNVFREHLGLTPHQYLVNRRMHGVHAALCRADADDTVSEICGRFGIWDFGRFARAYRHRFGRSPSTQLALGRRRH